MENEPKQKAEPEVSTRVIGNEVYVRKEFPLVGPGDKTGLPEEPKEEALVEEPKKSFEETCREMVDRTLNKSFELEFEPTDYGNFWAKLTVPEKYWKMIKTREKETIQFNGGKDIRTKLISPSVMPVVAFEEWLKLVWNALSSDTASKEEIQRKVEADRREEQKENK